MAAPGPKRIDSGDGESSVSSAFLSTAIATSVVSGAVTDEGANTTIEYSAELIDTIRAEAVGALLSLPHGGLEIAGVLFGKITGRTIYLAACRSMACEHAAGPSFNLSRQDEAQLETLLAGSRTDPELEGLQILGWYVSHTRRPFGLARSDAEVFDRFFGLPLQVTGVVKPAESGKAQFAWFVRSDNLSVDLQRPTCEFTVSPGYTASPPAPLAELPIALEKRGGLIPFRGSRREELPMLRQPAAVALAPLDTPPQRVPGALLSVPRVRRLRVSSLATFAVGLMLLVCAGSFFWLWRMRASAASPPPLHVLDTGSQLRIDWDPSALVVQRAQTGLLEIKEPSAPPMQISLSRDMLRTGSVLYNRPSSKVEIHLKLQDGKGAVSESMVYFIGREQAPLKTEPTSLAQATPPVPATPAIRPPDPPKPSPQPAADLGPAERARSVALNPRAFTPPVLAKTSGAPEPALLEAPKIAIPQTQTGAPLVGSLRTETLLPPPVATEISRPRPPPSAGRLIWTGDLHKGAVLQVGERGASTGSLNGKLPARPIKVNVHSAELLDGVIAIYTADANSTRTAEAPGRRNGWNVTLYKFDPKHVHDLSLVQTPSEENNWKLAIKSVTRPVSIIVIDWLAAN